VIGDWWEESNREWTRIKKGPDEAVVVPQPRTMEGRPDAQIGQIATRMTPLEKLICVNLRSSAVGFGVLYSRSFVSIRSLVLV
jgi:hypothetical protein